MFPQAARSTAGPAEETCSARIGRECCAKVMSKVMSEFSQRWRNSWPNQAIVRKANQKIKGTKV